MNAQFVSLLYVTTFAPIFWQNGAGQLLRSMKFKIYVALAVFVYRPIKKS